MRPYHFQAARRQHGVTLVIVLLLLVVVTLLGVGAARMALLGERSARNDRDYQVAWQAAEAALMDAQFDIRGPNASAASRVGIFTQENKSVFRPGCNTTPPYLGLCWPVDAPGKPVWATVDFTDDSGTTVEYGTYTGRTFDSGGTGVRPARAPRYMIEWVPDVSRGGDASSAPAAKIMYRVTAMGFGTREDVQVVMQMAFKKE